ncbi:hypothetical protein BDN72DRAFT_767082 [Pluteus cervinus]|uniref:Uncharacterized protein n=1 Tax=Pluteus cervinus TaxID=181527 RepID=A0ACD3AWU5_9AGAR|nr:hypothetical protein BDN72DRAFT_767082 [Pluteus cervinus]
MYAPQDTTHPPAYALCSSDGQNIYTVDEHNSRVQCILVSGPHVIKTGSIEEVTAWWSQKSSNGDDPQDPASPLRIHSIPPGSMVVPGLTDSHCHVLEYGASRTIPLDQATTLEGIALIRQYIESNPDIYDDKSKVIEGWGWDHASWPHETLPTATDLDTDPILCGRPIILQSRDGHALWVSPATLRANSPIPDHSDGGIIIRDHEGNPTGIFLDNAQDLISRPPATDSDLEKRFQLTVAEALSHGLTSLHDAGFKPESLAFFQSRVETKGLPIRLYGMRYFDENAPYWGDQTAPLIGDENSRLTARSIKLFADGALRTGGAALYEPYTDNPSTNGVMRLAPELLNTIIPNFLRDGWQVNVHAIGDRANGAVLDAFEQALKNTDVSSLRPRLEHAQIMTQSDIGRLGKLGVIASIQPTHVTSDMGFAEERLGPERVKGLYAFRSILKSGARITLGSDFPVEQVNPLAGFFSAITRTNSNGTSPHGPGGWFPDQRLTREEALRGMTIDPAYASFTESNLGSLVPGKRADFVILSQDIMTIPVTKIMDTKVLATVIDGEVVYGQI